MIIYFRTKIAGLNSDWMKKDRIEELSKQSKTKQQNHLSKPRVKIKSI